ncbi:hypothetical protein I6E29_06985 [Arcanobacterium haemolyticum]|nr:hypothetical protein [Arcanobacterium haemolyticum]
MAWRPISGEIVRFDPSLATIESIEEFCARHGVIARGSDEDGTYHLEIAVTGRRRRVAIVSENDEVVAGPSLSDLVELMDKELRKVQVEIAGHMAWGNIDLGEVDVALDNPGVEGSDSSRDDSEVDEFGEVVDGLTPEFLAGPMLAISDVSFAALPDLAKSIEHPIAAFRLGKANAVISDVRIPERRFGISPGFVLVLSADPSGVDTPILSVRHHAVRRTWEWAGERPLLPWVAESAVAREFATNELGAGMFVSRICEALPQADAARLREALLGDPATAARAVTAALGLAPEVSDCLDGLLEARLLPGATLFEPKPFQERIQTAVAYEVAGQGWATPEFWRVYRKLYLERPRLMEVVATAQAGVGGLIFAAGVRKWQKTSGKLLTVLGAGLAVNAGTRIVVTQWVQAALESEGLAPTGEARG